MILKNQKLRKLEEYCKRDPIRHAFTLWDLREERALTDFFIDWNNTIKGYMIIYYGTSVPSVIIYGEEDSIHKFINKITLNKAIIHLPYKYADLWRGEEKIYKILIMSRKPEKFSIINKNIVEIHNASMLNSLFQDPRYLVEKAKTWGFIKDNKVVSSISALAYTREVWILGALITKRDYRRMGYATKLIYYFLSTAYNNTNNIVLWVRDDNYPALNLYRKLNFKQAGEDAWINIGVNILP